MASHGKAVARLSSLLNIFAGCCLVGMTALTCADVILRLFRRPILGTYEIVGFLGAVVAAFAMAYTTIKRGHVAVEILVIQLPRRMQGIVYVLTHLLGLALFALLAWESFCFGNDLRNSGEVSSTLQLPFYPVLYGIAFSSLVVFIVLLLDLWNVITGKEDVWYVWEK